MDDHVREYLIASESTAICIIRSADGFFFRTGIATIRQPGVETVLWAPRWAAVGIVRKARQRISHNAAIEDQLAELHRSAGAHNVALTPNDKAIARAKEMAGRLQCTIETMYANGGLSAFNRKFKELRRQACAKNEGFMNYSTAILRFRRAAIGHLSKGEQVDDIEALFNEVFDRP